MSFNFSAAYPTGPTATSPTDKAVKVKVVKLTNADFSTGGTAAVKAVLPQDASILGFRVWIKTQLAGGGITAAGLQVGVSGNAGKFLNGVNVFGSASTYTIFTAQASIMQDQGVETGDISLLFTGTATTGNPTSGEMYIVIEYVR